MTKIQSMAFAAFLACVASPVLHAQSENPPSEQAGDSTAVSPENMTDTAAKTQEMIIQRWPDQVQSTAKLLTEKYGAVSAFDDKQLIWGSHAPWKRIVLHRDGVAPSRIGKSAAGGDKDHLEQVVSYRVPEEKVADLKKFDKRIKVNRDAGELSSVADSESINCLNLNLADDIIKGQRSVLDARAFAVKTSMLEKMGKSSPYLEGIIFKIGKNSDERTTPAVAPRTPMMPENVPVPNGGE